MVYPGQFFLELKMLSYYASLLLAFELGIYFFVIKKRNPGKTPSWTLTFSIFFLFTGILILIRAFSGFLSGENAFLVDLLTRVNNAIATGETMLILHFSKDYFESKESRASNVFKPLIIIWAVLAVLQCISIFGPFPPYNVMQLITVITVLVNVGFPAYFMLQLLKRSQPRLKKVFVLIFLGIIFAFLGIFLHSPDAEALINSILPAALVNGSTLLVLVFTIIYLGMITIGVYFLPPIEDFFWTEKLLALYVLKQGVETPVFKRYFQSLAREGKGPEKQLDEGQYLAGGIEGINQIVADMIMKSGNKLNFIDQGDAKLLLSYDGDLIFLVVSKINLPIIRSKLYNFKENFMMYFGDKLEDWNGDPRMFSPVEGILKNVFPRVEIYKEGEA